MAEAEPVKKKIELANSELIDKTIKKPKKKIGKGQRKQANKPPMDETIGNKPNLNTGKRHMRLRMSSIRVDQTDRLIDK